MSYVKTCQGWFNVGVEGGIYRACVYLTFLSRFWVIDKIWDAVCGVAEAVIRMQPGLWESANAGRLKNGFVGLFNFAFRQFKKSQIALTQYYRYLRVLQRVSNKVHASFPPLKPLWIIYVNTFFRIYCLYQNKQIELEG